MLSSGASSTISDEDRKALEALILDNPELDKLST